mmetsp:Transcript_1881/g.4144  ORF Transcript_1881/g.4144 Transcript_1881/m.4144 type:complete len:328 (-) Transcript_1881:22-1005(-)
MGRKPRGHGIFSGNGHGWRNDDPQQSAPHGCPPVARMEGGRREGWGGTLSGCRHCRMESERQEGGRPPDDLFEAQCFQVYGRQAPFHTDLRTVQVQVSGIRRRALRRLSLRLYDAAGIGHPEGCSPAGRRSNVVLSAVATVRRPRSGQVRSLGSGRKDSVVPRTRRRVPRNRRKLFQTLREIRGALRPPGLRRNGHQAHCQEADRSPRLVGGPAAGAPTPKAEQAHDHVLRGPSVGRLAIVRPVPAGGRQRKRGAGDHPETSGQQKEEQEGTATGAAATNAEALQKELMDRLIHPFGTVQTFGMPQTAIRFIHSIQLDRNPKTMLAK